MKIVIFVLMLIALLFIGLTINVSVFQLIKKKEYEKIKFLREYKKGRFCLIYISSFFIYIANSLYLDGFKLVKNIAEAFKHTVNSVVFKMEFSNIESFYYSNNFYKLIIFLFYVVLIINACLFILSIVYPSLSQMKKYRDFLKSNEKIMFIGCNEDTYKMLQTVNRKTSEPLVIDLLSDVDRERLIGKKIAFKKLKDSQIYKLSDFIKKINDKSKYDNIKIIVHTQDEEKNLIITREISNLIAKYDNKLDINTYVLGIGDSQTVFNSYVEKSNGRIHYINKHYLIATNFIDRYPITKFMNDNHIDYNTATIKDDVNINVYMIGYGKTNQEIFLASVANNQFVSLVDNQALKKNVNYYIYDKNDFKTNKNLNHYYYRLENEENYFKGREDEFLPLDVKPAEIKTPEGRDKSIDINNPKFYQYLYEDICNTKANDINYIIISFGSKTENIDMADKIVSKIHEWKIEKQTKVFVRIKDSKFIDESSLTRKIEKYEKIDNDFYECNFKNKKLKVQKLNQLQVKETIYYTFGEEDKIIFDLEKIFNNKEEIIAKNRDAVYTLRQDETLKQETLDKVYAKWYTKTQTQRDSNYYAYLSIRTKLNLLGLDYIDEKLFDDKLYTKVSFEEFYQKYFDKANVEEESKSTFDFKGKQYTRTTYKTKLETKDCIRTYLGMQEHLRWNAYTISRGVVPSTIDEIISSTNDGKDYLITRKHNCITTFEGLKQLDYLLSIKAYISDLLAKQCGEKTNISFKQKACELMKEDFNACKQMFDSLEDDIKNEYLIKNDLINYDYQILDDLEWLFKLSGYVLIEKK